MKNDPKIINAWCLYDWANSVYSLVISSTLFPIYYNAVTQSPQTKDHIEFLGFSITNTVLYSFALSFSFFLIAAISPFLSGIADYTGRKKQFMRFFILVGSLSCIGLYFFNGQNIEYGILCTVLASAGFSGSLVFYNAFLPEIATPDRVDLVSAKGFGFGYIGSVLLLIFNLLTINFYTSFGFSTELNAVRFSFVLVGVWWILFSSISLYFLPSTIKNVKEEKVGKKGYYELVKVWKNFKHIRSMKLFLAAFFFYSAGVQTIMLLAATFGNKELHLPGSKLILAILIIQLVAILGSYLFAKLSARKGNKFSLSIMLIIWMLICLAAYFTSNEYQFYGIAFAVGLVMGGIQSLSRSTYSKLIPENTNDPTSYFSFYDVVEKISIIIGTFGYGLLEYLTGSMRNSALLLELYFVIGFLFLLRLNSKFLYQKNNT